LLLAIGRRAIPSLKGRGTANFLGTDLRLGTLSRMPIPLRSNVLRMTPYTPGKPIDEVKRELGLSEVVKLASNENPLGPSPLAIQAVQEAAPQMHLYPDASGYSVKEKIATKFGVERNNVLLGNGSDELIHLLGLVLLEPGTNMVVGNPTFVRYDAAAHLADIELRKVPLTETWHHDLDAMAAACDSQTRLVFVANPHNPTGTVREKADFEAFLAKLPSTAVCVIDEAYVEYASDLDLPDSVGYVREGRPVVALRTFSKAYGLAGIRVGYGIAPAEIVDAIDRAREPFDVNSLAQIAAIAALDDEKHLAESRKVNAEGMARIAALATELGLTTVPSRANFICIHVKRPGQEVFDALLKRGVIVRSGGPLGMTDYVRVSIGTPDEVSAFLTAFREVMA